MSPQRRLILERMVVARIAAAMVDALKENLDESMDLNEQPLAPLGVWDKLNFASPKGTGQRWRKADRTNSMKPLVDTGRLKNSIHVQIPIMPSDGTHDGRPGRSYLITIACEDYGVEQANGGLFTDVALGRTKDIRRARNFGDMNQNVDFVVKAKINVPARAWNGVTRTRLHNIADASVR